MRRMLFQCDLLSDVIVTANAATEGGHESLDYLPGSAFLGIAAKKYQEFASDAYAVFHAAGVSFGDAHPVDGDGGRTLRQPAAWFTEKGESVGEGSLYVHHRIPKEKFGQLTKSGTQLKQARGGFFNPSTGKIVKCGDKRFAVKSAYDADKRRAADSLLFGYEALPGGSSWQFEVRVDDDDRLAEKVKAALEGEHNIGRSRSAQFGRCQIKFTEDAPDNSGSIPPGEVVIYAESHLAFFDKFGQPTIAPELKYLGIPGIKRIIWEKCQVRNLSYAPWNAKRKSRDADRVCIAKGSVLVVETDAPINPADHAMGIGVYRNEGFGRVIFNPAFLDADESGLAKVKLSKDERQSTINRPSIVESEPESDEILRNWLDAEAAKQKREKDILAKVNEFVEKHGSKFKGKFASQWGEVRAIAQTAKSHDDLYDKLFKEPISRRNQQGDIRVDDGGGYLMHGRSQERWNKQGRRNALEKFLEENKTLNPELCVKLAAEMAKCAGQAPGFTKEMNDA